jgi:hypothetical protein
MTNNGYNIIGDIAGQYDTLIALLAKMPQGAVPVSLGDMVDRGPKSRQVLEFFAQNGKALLANHEHMMLDHFTNGGYYEPGLWVYYNGGMATIKSFGPDDAEDIDWRDIEIDRTYLDYIKSLPMYMELPGNDRYPGGAFLSHAPRRPDVALSLVCELGDGFWRPSGKFDGFNMDSTLIWNRGAPREIKGVFQIHGHNSSRVIEWYGGPEKPWGVNLDTSRAREPRVLTGMHWPSMEIFQQEYILPPAEKDPTCE